MRSVKFSSLANELAAILTTSVKNKTLDVVSRRYPDLDKSQLGYTVVYRDELLKSYAGIILKYTNSNAFPVVGLCLPQPPNLQLKCLGGFY